MDRSPVRACAALIVVGCCVVVLAGSPALSQPHEQTSTGLIPPRQVVLNLTGHDSGIHLRDLDAVRMVNERAALAAALKRAKQTRLQEEREIDRGRSPYRRIVDPAEVAEILRVEYGPDSILARSVNAVAALAGAAERGSQVPLDRVNRVTDTLAASSSQALGLPLPPGLHLRSRVTSRRAGVTVSAKW